MSLLDRLLDPLRSLFGGEDGETGDGRTKEGAPAGTGADDTGPSDGGPNDAGTGATSGTTPAESRSTEPEAGEVASVPSDAGQGKPDAAGQAPGTRASKPEAEAGPTEGSADEFELRGRLDPDSVTRVRDETPEEGAPDERTSGETPAPGDPDAGAEATSPRGNEGTDGADRLDPEAVRRTRTRARAGDDEAVDRLRDLRARATDEEPERDGGDEEPERDDEGETEGDDGDDGGGREPPGTDEGRPTDAEAGEPTVEDAWFGDADDDADDDADE